MMFFSEEDESKDQLFLYLARTRCMLTFLMYGRHAVVNPESNRFLVYIKPSDIEKIRLELGLQGRGGGFNLEEFLRALNNEIPQHLNFTELQESCRRHREAFTDPQLRKVVDQSDKIYLIGPRRLDADRKPREKTLRKLYLHVDGEPAILEQFIQELKRRNMTLAWTDDPERANGDVRWMLNNI